VLAVVCCSAVCSSRRGVTLVPISIISSHHSQQRSRVLSRRPSIFDILDISIYKYFDYHNRLIEYYFLSLNDGRL